MDKPTMDGFEPEDVNVLLVKSDTQEIWSYTSEFKGHIQYHIRDVYFQNDVWKPGKGISMPAECQEEFLANLLEANNE